MVFVTLYCRFGCVGNRQIKQVSAITAKTEIWSPCENCLQSEHRYSIGDSRADSNYTLRPQSVEALTNGMLVPCLNDKMSGVPYEVEQVEYLENGKSKTRQTASLRL